MAMQLKEGEYRCRQYGSGHSNSGATGRKMRGFNVMRQEAAKAAKAYTTVLFCSDQHGSQGSGCIGKAVFEIGPNAIVQAANMVAAAMRDEPAMGLITKFRSGLWRIEPPWFMAMWTPRFWQRQRVRYKVWRITGHHFLWNQK